MIRAAAALSTATLAGVAVAELETALRPPLGGAAPDLLFVFAGRAHAERLHSIAGDLRTALGPRHLLGCTGDGQIARATEVEREPAIAALALVLPQVRIQPFHARCEESGSGFAVKGLPAGGPGARDEHAATFVLADPFSFVPDALIASTANDRGAEPLLGGMAGGASGPGGVRLLLDDEVIADGAVGVRLSGRLRVRPIVSQGCRPVGRHYVITKGQQNMIRELGGRSALAVIHDVLSGLPEDERRLLQGALHIGRAIDEYKSAYGRGDFLVRSVVGVDHATGAIAINDTIHRGQTVQFQARDPAAAAQDLELLLQEERSYLDRHPPRAALLFTCNGRGRRMFGVPNHDAALLARALGPLPVAGFFAGGEFGPVGGHNFLHGFTASLGVICEPEPDA